MTLVANFAEIVAEFLRKSALCDRRLHVEQIMPLGSKLSRSKRKICDLILILMHFPIIHLIYC